MTLEQLPKKMVVVGSGAIGVEFAYFYRTMGSEVTVVEYLPRLSDQIGHASEAVHRTLESAPAHVDAVAQRLADSGVVHSIQDQAQAEGDAKFLAHWGCLTKSIEGS